MVKYIYQAVALVFIFAGALFLFGRNMETDMEEILIIPEMVAVEPAIYVVTSGVPIRCANVWEVIFAHAYKIKRNRLYGDADGSCYRLYFDWMLF